MSGVTLYPSFVAKRNGERSWSWRDDAPLNMVPIHSDGRIEMGGRTWFYFHGYDSSGTLPEFIDILPDEFPTIPSTAHAPAEQLNPERFDFWRLGDDEISIELPSPETRNILKLLYEHRALSESLSWRELQQQVGSNHRGLRDAFGRPNGNYSEAMNRLVLSDGHGVGTRYRLHPKAVLR